MVNKKELKYPTDNVDDDIDLYLRLLKYGKAFIFKSKWYDRTNLYVPRQDEESFVKRCRDKMLAVGLLRIKEKAPESHLEDILELSLLGDEIQKIGWKKYLEQSSKKKFDFDKYLNRINIFFTVALSITTIVSLMTTIRAKQETEQLKFQLDSLKTEVREWNSKMNPVDTAGIHNKK